MFRKLTLFSVVLTAIILVLGLPVRIGDISAGIIDHDLIEVIKTEAHKYLTMALGFTVLSINIVAWLQKPLKLKIIITSFIVFFIILLQAALTFFAFLYTGYPIVIAFHLISGLLIFWLLYYLLLHSGQDAQIASLNEKTKSENSFLKALIPVAVLLLIVEITLGIWVTVNHGAMACNGFPQCNGQWIPQADFASALDLIRGLITQYDGVISYDGQVAINWLHRVNALVVFIVLSALMFLATSTNSTKSVKKAGLLLGILLFGVVGLEIVALKFHLPLWMGTIHYALAVLLMLPLISIGFYSGYSRESVSEIEHVSESIEQIAVTEEGKEEDLTVDIAEVYVEPLPESLYLRLKAQLKRTRTGLGGFLAGLPLGQKDLNAELIEDIEANLLMADVGIDATTEIIRRLTTNLERHELKDSEALASALKQELYRILKPCSQPLEIPKQNTPFVILVVGVNGAGKTTTIGKLAKRLQAQGHSLMLAAGDTFRAAAVEQLQVWGERNNIPVVAQHTGADSASVIYDGLQSAKAKGVDVLIADTAGRLHTKSNLMEELKKIKRIMGKLDSSAPHEVLLVLDAGTGQNALSQAKLFNEAVSLSGLVLTKLDGTAKGGVIFALAKHAGIPIRYIGIGEGIDDLQDFDAELFVDALFVNE